MLRVARKLSPMFLLAEKLSSQGRLIRPDLGTAVTFPDLQKTIADNKQIVYFGETHEQREIILLQLAVLECLVERVKEQDRGSVSVVLEHFNLSQQPLLDSYQRGDLDPAGLLTAYQEGEEGHDIGCYGPLLQYARSEAERVHLVAGFLPRSMARLLVKEGKEVAYGKAKQLDYLDSQDMQEGSEEHYNWFEGLISGRCLLTNYHGVGDNFRRIFPAQIIKDCTMAATIRKRLERATSDDIFLVIAGSGHLDYRMGVPERVDRYGIVPRERTCIITVRPFEEGRFQESKSFECVEQFETKFPGDFVFFYRDSSVEEAEGERLKEEIAAAYEQVASTAHMEGNIRLASKVMARLGYSTHQIQVAGADAYNYQGVGSPHQTANLKPGEHVLDIGSGLGVDSFIAAEAVGPAGSVTGLDLSAGEVKHATLRAQARHCSNVSFIHGDMESIPLPDNHFDAVISNGAFCLAPNKERAFREIFRVLKPGGRVSVACTTLLKQLDSETNWPVCMRVFMPLSEALPLLERVGFRHVIVDTSDSKMNLELQLDPAEQEAGASRKGVHVGSAEFRHLEHMDMDQLCARVILYGIKPSE